MKDSTVQNIFWALAVVCLFGGFMAVAEHDYIKDIPTSNAVSAAGYIIGLVGTAFCLYMVNRFSKPKDQR